MSETNAVQHLLLSQIDNIATNLQLDFLYERNETGELLGQMIQRDESGSILETPLSFVIHINEEKGKGTFKFYTPKGELSSKDFNIQNPQTIIAILAFIQGFDHISQT